MIRSRKLALASTAILAFSVFATDLAQAQSRQRGDRAERPIPGRQRADPGKVAATDIAFARAARDNGQWTAFTEFAAPGAQFHGNEGPYDAGQWLLTRANPPAPLRWAPNTVWSSCDGSIAVSFGRWTRPDKTVGSYVTVWQRQPGREGSYRWVYHTGAPDNPQPVPPPAEVAPDEDTIVVTEMLSITARAADCAAPEGMPKIVLSPISTGAQTGGGEARDGSLRWRWEQIGTGDHRVTVDWLRDGEWQQALDFDVTES